jgi:hypothetical protein
MEGTMKAKMFAGFPWDWGQEDEYLNRWLAENPSIKIKHTVQSVGAVDPRGSGEQEPYIVLTVFYE